MVDSTICELENVREELAEARREVSQLEDAVAEAEADRVEQSLYAAHLEGTLRQVRGCLASITNDPRWKLAVSREGEEPSLMEQHAEDALGIAQRALAAGT